MKKVFKIWIIPLLAIFITIVSVYFYDQRYQSNPAIQNNNDQIDENNISAPQIKETRITFVIGGDMMFARNISYNFRDDHLVDVVSNLGQELFSKADLSIINLEGPISKRPVKPNNTKGLMTFNFPPETLLALKWLGVNTVSLANNHTNNMGVLAFSDTKTVLDEHNISHIGQEAEFNENSIKEYSFNEKKISVIAINSLEVTKSITETIKTEKEKSDYVIILPHWGIEYKEIHSKDQQYLAHAWINAGADMIFGSHPHVVQDIEFYKNRPIIYSMGNLLFDQDFSIPTQRGLIVSGFILDDQLEMTLLPTESIKYKPQLQTGQAKVDSLKKLYNGIVLNQSDEVKYLLDDNGNLEKITTKLVE